MIQIRRPDAPPSFQNARLREIQETKIEEWLKLDASTRSPLRLDLRHGEIPGFMDDLLEGFNYKCPFCETKIQSRHEADLLFFRPTDSSLQKRDGTPDPNHYCWLIWDWSNIFPACGSCVQNKGRLFPTKGKRAGVGTYEINHLAKEEPLLVNPCIDDPDEFLIFFEKGTVIPKNGSDRGAATVETFALDRESLRTARNAEATKLKKIWEDRLHGEGEAETRAHRARLIYDELKLHWEPEQEFAGMKRQLLERWLRAELLMHDEAPEDVLADPTPMPESGRSATNSIEGASPADSSPESISAGRTPEDEPDAISTNTTERLSLENEIRPQTTMTPGLSPQLSHEIRATLLTCGPFDSADRLRPTFTDARIAAWRNHLPDAGSSAQRVEATVDFLYHKYNENNENGLALLLQVLAERTSPGDSCRQRLLDLAAAIAEDSKQQFQRVEYRALERAPAASHHLPVELQEQLAAGDVTLFVGHRLSEAAGLPGREEIAAALARRLGEATERNATYSAESLPDIAQLYEVARGRHALVNYLRDRLDTTRLQPGAAHRALAELPVPTIFSAAYDDLLDRALRRAGRRVNKVTGDATLAHAGSERLQLIKLKGEIEQPESLVVTRSDFDQYALQRPLTLNHLRDRLASATFLLLGFDATDPDLKFIFEQSGYQAAAGRLHYALMSPLSSLQQQLLQKRQIQALDVPLDTLPAWLRTLVN